MRFIALDVSLGLIGDLRTPLARLRRLDPDLHRQLRRAASSIALNLSQGAERCGKDASTSFASLAAARVRWRRRFDWLWRGGDLKPGKATTPLETLDRLLGASLRTDSLSVQPVRPLRSWRAQSLALPLRRRARL